MPSGYPDWNTTLDSRGIYSSDVNDLAVRLGGLSRYSRSGKMLYATNFCADFPLWLKAGPNDFVPKPDLSDGFFYPGCLSIIPTGVVTGTFQCYRYMPAIFNTTYGLEFSYKAMSNVHDNPGIEFVYHDGNNAVTYQLYLDYFNQKVKAYTTGGVFADIADLSLTNLSNVSFGIVKVYIDVANRKYKKLQVMGQDIILADIPPVINVGGAADTDLLFGVILKTTVAFLTPCKFGHMILTFGE